MTISHLALLPDIKPDALCVICGQDRPDVCCERCGAPLHGDCFWIFLATPAELSGYRAMRQDGVDRWIPFLCQGCRS